MTGKEHKNLLSIFFFVQAGLQALGGVFAAVMYGGVGAMFVANDMPDAEFMGGFMLVMGIVVGLFTLVFAVFYAVTGWRLKKDMPGAKVLGIIASCIALLGFPLGTALGIYGLWFFLGENGKEYYSGTTASPVPPPPPNSWQ